MNKQAKTKIILSIFLFLVVLTSSIYFVLNDNVRIDIGETYSTFKVLENGSWIVSGIEYTKLMDGTKNMRASSRVVNFSTEGNITTSKRFAYFKNNCTAIDTYVFDSSTNETELFPISHLIEAINCEEYTLIYEVTKLEYFGETDYQIGSSHEFGHNMKVEWSDGNYYERLYKYVDRNEGKLTIKYHPTSHFNVSVRLFDPIISEDTVFTKLISNKAGLTSGESIFEINNPVDNFSTSDMFFTNYLAKGNPITLDEYQIQVTEEIEIPKYVDYIIEKTYIELDNETGENITKTINSTVQLEDGFKLVNITSWKKVDTLPKGNHLIKYKANWKAHIGPQTIDWFVNINLDKIKYNLPKDAYGLVESKLLKSNKWAWWNVSFGKTRKLGNLTGNFSYMNITYDSDMQADFDDLRFTNTANDTEFNFTISDKVNSAWVTVRVHNLGDTSSYMYYGNADVSTTSSASDTYFDTVVAYYLDESSDPVIDSVGNHNGANDGGATPNVAGAIGTAYDFEKDEDDYIELTDFNLDTNVMSISLRFKPESITNYNFIATKWSSAGATRGYVIATNGDGDLHLQISNDGTNTQTFTSSPTFSAGNWYNIIMTYDGTTVRGYSNGVSIVNGSYALGIFNPSGIKNRIGWTYDNTASLESDGIIDEVKYWNKTLTQDQINQLHTENEPVYTLGAEESSNTAPTLTANATKPDTVYTNTDWLTNLTATDPEETYIDSYVQFYVNDAKSGNEITYNMTNNTNHLVATLLSGNFSEKNNLTAEIWLSDRIENSTKVNLTVTVQNYDPVIIANETKPDIVYSNTDYLINLTATDLDNNYINSWIQFYVDDVKTGVEQFYNLTNNTNSLVATLAHANFNYTNNLIAEVWVGDGINNITKENLTSEYVYAAKTITLNSPVDNFYSTGSNVTFNCTGNITGVSLLVNVSLYGNFTGTWALNETYSSFGDGQDYIYDEINDSSINASLWDTNTTGTTPLLAAITETADYISLSSSRVDADWGTASETLTSNNFPSDLSQIENITIRVYLGVSEDGPTGGNANFRIFGNTIKGISTETTDDSVWTFVQNYSTGSLQYDVYDDSVYESTINPSGSLIRLYAYQEGSSASSYSNGNARIYYVYYTEDAPTSSTRTFTKTINDTTLWTCEICDSDNDCKFSDENRTVFLDDVVPFVEIIYPTAINYTINVSELNYTASDANPDKCWYSVDNGTTNSSAVSYNTNFTNVTSSEGWNTWTVYCNDTPRNLNSSNVTFYKDTILPKIEYATNSDTSNSSGNFSVKDWIFINVSVNESSVANVTFWTWTSTNTSFNKTTVTNQADNYILNQTNLSRNIYFWNVTVCDWWGNCNYTDDRYYGDEEVNFSINALFANQNVELGTILNISGTNTFDWVFIDVDHPSYGTNYSSGKWSTTFELIIDWFRKTLFADGTNTSSVSYNSTTDYNESKFNITGHQYDEVINISVNITGTNNPYDIGIFKCNTSTDDIDNYDRFFKGNLTSDGYIWQDKLVVRETSPDGYNATKNISFYNAGEQFIYFYIDSGASLVSFLLNVSSTESGIEYSDSFTDWDNIDTDLTDMHLDEAGAILSKNSSLAEFIYDDFEDASIDTDRWVKTADYSDSGSGWAISRTISETGGYVRMHNDWDNLANVLTGSGTLNFYPNYTHFSLIDSNSFTFNISNTYGSNADNIGCSGNTFIYLGGTLIWTNYYEPDNDVGSNQIESSSANLVFNLTKYNSTYWRVQISGIETSTVFQSAEGCDWVTGTYNWTKGAYSISKQACANVEGSLDNDFYSAVTYNTLYPFRIRNYVSLDAATCESNEIDTRIYWVNNSLWSRENSTVISKSILDTSTDIISATMAVFGLAGQNESITGYLSADDGDNWENVVANTKHSFSNTGKHLKWKFEINMTDKGYKNVTTRITGMQVSVSGGNLSDVYFDVGDDGTYEYSILGDFTSDNGTVTVDLSNASLSGVFDGSVFVGQTYYVPVSINSSSMGQINIEAINLTYNPNPIYLNIASIQNFLTNLGSAITNFSIDVASYGIGAIINLTDLRYDYKGGNDTISITAHNNDSSINITRNITYYYSSFSKDLPYTWVDKIFFMPRTNSSKNVTAYGQTSTIPVYNITTTNYGGDMNMSIKVNESFSCLNITWNDNSTKPSGNKLNTSWQSIGSNLEYLNNTQIWLWADFDNCNASDQRVLQPHLFVEGYCINCIWE